MPNTVISVPKRVAHRGFSANLPENTSCAFDAAISQGFGCIETDVQLSADGHPIIFHDATLQRTSGLPQAIANTPLAEFEHIDIGSWKGEQFADQRLMSLASLLKNYPQLCWLLELKLHETDANQLEPLATAVSQQLTDTPVTHFVLSFSEPLLQRCAQLNSHSRYVLNLEQGDAATANRCVKLPWVHALSVNVNTLSAEFVKIAHQAGKPVFVFTVNTQQQLNHALACGVDAVMSDRCQWLAEQPTLAW